MANSLANRLWLQTKYICIVFAILFVQTLPLNIDIPVFLAPDFIIAVTFAWALHRPDVMVPIIVCFALLLADFILHRPPGVWALIVLMGSVFLRNRSGDMLYTMYVVEWGLVSLVILGCYILYQTILIITFSGASPFAPFAAQIIATCAIYPIVTFVSRRFMGVYKTGPVDANSVRRRA